MRAAAENKVKRVVLTSSTVSISASDSHKYDKKVYTDKDWTNPKDTDDYSRSKVMAEKVAWDFVESLPAD